MNPITPIKIWNNLKDYLPNNYRQIVAEKVDCHVNMVSEVVRQLKEDDIRAFSTEKKEDIIFEMNRLRHAKMKRQRELLKTA